jgi:hypothetical protein
MLATLIGVAERSARRVVLGGLDIALHSRLAEEAVERVLASPLMERAVSRALQGPLVEAVARDLERYAVIERATGPLLDGEELERVVARLIDSHLADEAVRRLLASDDLWLVVDTVARSPSVTEAIGRQGVGFAEQVAGTVRVRSQSADARLEQVARRLLRRPPRNGGLPSQPAP